ADRSRRRLCDRLVAVARREAAVGARPLRHRAVALSLRCGRHAFRLAGARRRGDDGALARSLAARARGVPHLLLHAGEYDAARWRAPGACRERRYFWNRSAPPAGLAAT